MLRTRDNWERLVAAVLKKQQLWELFHAHSRSPSVLSEASSSGLSSPSFGIRLEDAVTRLENRVLKLVLVSEFVPAFDVEEVNLTSLGLLGTGTFGSTYVGHVSDEVKIVVKRVEALGVSEEKFKRSMDFVGRIRHENIVALRAYYCSEDVKLMLYDYYRNGSAHQLLHGKNNATVGWETRVRIAIGAARGLASIHAQNRGKLVHGNVKSSNIFLNRESYGCISDLGITNLTPVKFAKNARCYAPEVKNSTRNVSQESDVYSFGILLFELLTRKSPVQIPGGPDAADLVKLMKSVKNEQMTPQVFDADLLLFSIREQMVRVLQIGISCVAKSAKKRPKMSEVAKMLEDFDVHDRLRLVFLHQSRDISEPEDPFDFETLLRSSAEILGKGTFGTSYKVTLKTGLTVRVKRLKDGNVTLQEFQLHMDNISRIKHRNCAALMAYFFAKGEVLFVYDYYDGDSLSSLLHGRIGHRKPLSFEARLKIALTIAKGIHHIHQQDAKNPVHGNIRPSNIFLGRRNSAIITDIAASKLTKPIRHAALKRQGYIAPEVKDTSNVSRASDVYGFGVVLLELLTRRSPEEKRIDDRNVSLVKWVRNHVRAENFFKVFDAELAGYDEELTVEVLRLAMDCVETVPEQRPVMFEVVNKLQDLWDS